jgi:acyl phosphate:glycerol-3-phosphate acyltransferase
MIIIIDVLLVIAAYLIGSIPTSVWISRKFYGMDIREQGSGNAGATNTFRVLGAKAGLPVFLIDALKGSLAVNLAYLQSGYLPHSEHFVTFQIILGVAAVLGHVFPIYVGFKGGKGVATILGVFLSIATLPTLICFGIFFLVLFLTKYVSLSSIVAGLSFPFLQIGIFKTTIPSLLIFSFAVAILLVLTHQKNIQRLIDKEESKAGFLVRKRREKNN